MAADSFWVYQAKRLGGRVLFVERLGDPAGARTTWLEVDSLYRPVQGWERRVTPDGKRCATSFTVRDSTVEIATIREPGSAALQMSLHIPAHFAVALASPVADGWAIMASIKSGLAVSMLHLPDCFNPSSAAAGFAPRTLLARGTVDGPVMGRPGPALWVTVEDINATADGVRRHTRTSWLDTEHGVLLRAEDGNGAGAGVSAIDAAARVTLEQIWLAAP